MRRSQARQDKPQDIANAPFETRKTCIYPNLLPDLSVIRPQICYVNTNSFHKEICPLITIKPC